MRVTIIIPTPAGPRRITSLVHRPKLPRSQIITDTDYKPLEGISARYHDFVGSGTPLRTAVQIPAGQFDLRLDDTIESGRSWELPVAIAHWVLSCKGEIVAENPNLVIWATGSLTSDLDVQPNTYHLGAKLASSQDLLARYRQAGARVVVLVPPDKEFDARSLSDDGSVCPVTSLDDAVLACQYDTDPELPDRQSPKRLTIAGLAVCALLALGAAIYGFGFGGEFRPDTGTRMAGVSPVEPAPATTPTPEPPATLAPPATSEPTTTPAPPPIPTPATIPAATVTRTPPATPETTLAPATTPPPPSPDMPVVRLVEHRAPSGASCINVLLDGLAMVPQELDPVDSRFPDSSRRGLCAVGVHLVSAEGQVEISFDPAFTAAVMKSDRSSRINLAPGQTHIMRLIQNAGGPMNHAFTIKANGAEKSTRYAHKFVDRF